MPLTNKQKETLKAFVKDFQIDESGSWEMLGDMFIEVDRDNEGFFEEQYGVYLELFQILKFMLVEVAILKDRFDPLKYWHGRYIEGSDDFKDETKKQLGLVSAIGNFGDTFVDSVDVVCE